MATKKKTVEVVEQTPEIIEDETFQKEPVQTDIIQAGTLQAKSKVSTGNCADYPVTFPKPFDPDTVPVVVVGFISGSTAARFGTCTCAVVDGSVTNEGFKDLLGRNLPLDGFNCGLTNRYNCYNCQYACAHRKTDMTIGDLWDQSLYPQEHSKGVSMVITHTGAGEDLLRNAALECREIGWEGPLKANPRTFDGRTRVFYPRKRMVWLFEKLSEKSSASLYTMDIKPKQLLFYLFKIYRYLIQRYERARSRKLVDCLLISL